jgi:hypothetical protein
LPGKAQTPSIACCSTSPRALGAKAATGCITSASRSAASARPARCSTSQALTAGCRSRRRSTSSALVSPLFVAIDKILHMRRLDREQQEHPFAGIATSVGA